MPRDNGTEDRWYKELDAANLINGYTVIMYETWLGEDRTDPACQIEEWLSLFVTEDLPEEDSGATGMIREGTDYYVKESRYSYHNHFEGLKGAKLNEKVSIVKETDHDAARHQKESEAMMPDAMEASSYNRMRYSIGGVQYEDFLAAIDRVAEDDSDKEAWKTIETWRSRSLRAEERSL